MHCCASLDIVVVGEESLAISSLCPVMTTNHRSKIHVLPYALVSFFCDNQHGFSSTCSRIIEVIFEYNTNDFGSKGPTRDFYFYWPIV